jgi:hypothetical protein
MAYTQVISKFIQFILNNLLISFRRRLLDCLLLMLMDVRCNVRYVLYVLRMGFRN